jgi:hypothetical protein
MIRPPSRTAVRSRVSVVCTIARALLLLAAAAPAGCARSTRDDARQEARMHANGSAHTSAPAVYAHIRIGRTAVMNAALNAPQTSRGAFEFASALFVDSTRGMPEAGYWRVPAGAVSIAGGNERIVLTPTPDLLSGVGYFSPTGALHYVPETCYTVQVSGSDTVGAFSASVLTPTPPHLLSPAANVTVPRTSDLLITWTPGASADSVELELQPHSPSGYPHLIYHAADNGRFTVPKGAFDQFPSDYVTMITLTRRRATPVAARGLSGGTFEAYSSDYAHIRFQRRSGS